MIIRDVLAILLFVIGGARLFVSYYLIRAALAADGRRLWPPRAWPTELTLALDYSATGLFMGVLGIIVLGGTRPIPAWGIILIAAMGVGTGLLWRDFAYPQPAPEGGDRHV